MKVTDNVRAVQVPEDNPMHPRSTNIYVVGDDQVLSIDSGEAVDKFKWMIRGYLAAVEKAEIGIAAITHHHFDHSGNLKDLHASLGAEVAVPFNSVKLLKGRLPDTGVRLLHGEQTIDLDKGVKVRVIATPGHSVDSLCYYLEDDGVLFTGDTLLGVGTTTVQDLGAYRASLETLVALPNLKILCPGHGPLVYDARERLRTYIDHRNMREVQIVKALRRAGPLSSWDIMLQLYPDIDKRLHRAADGNVRAHLTQLEQEGRVRLRPGKAKRPNPARAARERAKASARRKIIRQAKRYEEQERGRALRLQENPPTEQWSRQPAYEIVDPGDAS